LVRYSLVLLWQIGRLGLIPGKRDLRKQREISAEELVNALGVSEEQAWGIRKDLLSSPQVLQVLYQLADQQGKTADFLASLSNIQTGWGTFDFRKQFEQGLNTGDWDFLNAAYADAFAQSQRLAELVPDITKLFAQNAPGADITQSDANAFEDALQPNQQSFGNMEKYLSSIDTNTKNPVMVRAGDQVFYVTIQTTGAGDDLVRTVKNQIIPIFKQEMTGGNTGLREAVVRAYNTTRGAY
jgi:transcriptional regulator with XRE-family HTH domain